MPSKLYIACIRWMTAVTPDGDPIKLVLDRTPGIDNWARLNVHVWLIKTNLPAETIADTIRRVISSENGVFVIAADPQDYSGFAPQLIWEWMKNNFGQ